MQEHNRFHSSQVPGYGQQSSALLKSTSQYRTGILTDESDPSVVEVLERWVFVCILTQIKWGVHRHTKKVHHEVLDPKRVNITQKVPIYFRKKKPIENHVTCTQQAIYHAFIDVTRLFWRRVTPFLLTMAPFGELFMNPFPAPNFAHYRSPQAQESRAVHLFAQTGPQADAFVLRMYFYHNSLSGIVKNMLDHLFGDQLCNNSITLTSHNRKRVAVQPSDQLQIVVQSLLATVIPTLVVIPNAGFGFYQGKYILITYRIEKQLIVWQMS